MISTHVPNLIYLFSNSNASGPPLIRGHGIIRTHGASPSLDSGRGDSPESSCNSTLVLTPNTTQSKLHLFLIFDREFWFCGHKNNELPECIYNSYYGNGVPAMFTS